MKKKNRQNILLQIKQKQTHIQSLKKHLEQANILNMKHIKKLRLSICIQQNELDDLERDLESLKLNSKKIIMSERLEMFFRIAKGLKPKLSEEIDRSITKHKWKFKK